MRYIYTIAFLATTQCLLACSGNLAQREDTVISESHSVYIEGGVLKVLSAGQRDVLYIYVRPEVVGRWVVAGGEGGNQSSPWLHKTTMFWAPGDEEGWFPEDSPRKSFSCLFDSRNKTLSMESGTYAVSEGGFIVISLDENWQPGKVKTGIDSLQVFDIPEENRKHLLSEARKHFR
jgi:hypothetical protein